MFLYCLQDFYGGNKKVVTHRPVRSSNMDMGTSELNHR